MNLTIFLVKSRTASDWKKEKRVKGRKITDQLMLCILKEFKANRGLPDELSLANRQATKFKKKKKLTKLKSIIFLNDDRNLQTHKCIFRSIKKKSIMSFGCCATKKKLKQNLQEMKREY